MKIWIVSEIQNHTLKYNITRPRLCLLKSSTRTLNQKFRSRICQIHRVGDSNPEPHNLIADTPPALDFTQSLYHFRYSESFAVVSFELISGYLVHGKFRWEIGLLRPLTWPLTGAYSFEHHCYLTVADVASRRLYKKFAVYGLIEKNLCVTPVEESDTSMVKLLFSLALIQTWPIS